MLKTAFRGSGRAIAASGRISSVSCSDPAKHPITFKHVSPPFNLVVWPSKPSESSVEAIGVLCELFLWPTKLDYSLTELCSQVRATQQGLWSQIPKNSRTYAADAKASPTEVASILESRIRGVQEEAGLAETGKVLSVGCVHIYTHSKLSFCVHAC